MFNGLQWHVYVADANGTAYDPLNGRPTHKLEVCMTGLCKQAAQQFFRTDKFVSAAHTTDITGIRSLVPGAMIDDYVFDPCGYSMNGILDKGFITIHITPEDGFSYASVEVSNFDPAAYDPADMVSRISSIFRPDKLSVSLSVDVASRTGDYSWCTLAFPPSMYGCQSATCQELAAGGRISYYTFSPIQAKYDRPDSPVTVLRHMPSFSSFPADSDFDLSSSGDENEGGVSRAGSGGSGSSGGRLRGTAAMWAKRMMSMDMDSARSETLSFAS
eukprot:jgi/Chrzof1/138/Cz01g04210.t1